jgi:hypothetical protein
MNSAMINTFLGDVFPDPGKPMTKSQEENYGRRLKRVQRQRELSQSLFESGCGNDQPRCGALSGPPTMASPSMWTAQFPASATAENRRGVATCIRSGMAKARKYGENVILSV